MLSLNEAAAADLAKLQAELARLTADYHSREQAMAGELAAVKAELELFTVARDEDCSAKSQLESLKEEYELLRTEYGLINEELMARNGDLQQLRSEKAAAEKTAVAAMASLRAEEQMAPSARTPSVEAPRRPTDRTEPASPPLAGPANLDCSTVDKAVSDLAVICAEPAPLPISSTGVSSPDSEASLEENTPFHFNLDHSLTAIPCRSGDDIVELHISFNTLSITPADHKPQNCSSYICGIEHDGATHVYVALYLAEDKKALVYVPEKQPADAAAYGRAIRDALSFAETAGFMMNVLPLDGGPAGRAKALKGIPVLG